MSFRSLRSAMAFLTVVPVADAQGTPGERLGRAYFPAVGALVGLAAGVAYAFLTAVSTPLLAAVAATAVLAVLTGALHLDGLADAADGLLGGGNVARRLEVMRDPRLGSFGTTTIVLVLVADVAAIASIPAARVIVALVIAGALSRLAMLAMIGFVPYIRQSGLGDAVQSAGHWRFDIALGCSITAVVCLLDWHRVLVALPLVALSSVTVGVLARRRIGGATGDIYGATAELGQLAVLVAFALQS